MINKRPENIKGFEGIIGRRDTGYCMLDKP
jgi:hypothetical protein